MSEQTEKTNKRTGSLEAPAIVRRTKLAEAVVAILAEERRAVVTPYDLFQILRRLFSPRSRKRLYLRHDAASNEDLRKVTSNLFKTRELEVDRDYGRSVYRALSAGESSADEVTALANPFGYISHLSALQRWGLTERRPDSLNLTMPPPSAARPLIEARMAADYETSGFGVLPGNIPLESSMKLHFIRHPKMVRGRPISVYQTRNPSCWLNVQDSHARLATVGQTFVDTVERPQYCGGMAHVIDIWEKHASTFREEIISTMDEVGSPIAKVRAGYLLDDMLNLGDDSRIQNWVRFAQRGSSRVLDPSKDFSSAHSEKWMLSINV